MSSNASRVVVPLLTVVAILGGGWFLVATRPEPLPDDAPPQVDVPNAAAGGAAGARVEDVRELPEIRASRFLNTTSAAQYVGGAACRDCHATEYESYLQTAHSQALGDIDLAQEPQEVRYDHPASGRSYRVYRQGDQLRHRESRQNEDGDELAFSDYAMRYVIGSGHHSRSYIVEDDGFLVESPVTWYSSISKWDMSPGYDRRFHMGFERIVDVGCLFCHVGRLDDEQDNRYRVTIQEQTIGCESCHGPGSLHVERHRGGGEVDIGDADLTIVNPNKLGREANESVCGLCHLRGNASVWMHGRDPMSFRPGLRLADFRIDYQLDDPDKSMKVVGHIEQMKLSRCYQESGEMTCTTCHDPHGRPPEAAKVEYFRQRCFACHDEGCQLETEQRLRRNAADNCIACHMKQSDTDIPHFAFTHHRVGFHDEAPAGDVHQQDSLAELVPIMDVSHLSANQRDRSLGMAYLEFSGTQGSDTAQRTHRERADKLLNRVYDQGMRDAQLEASLGLLAFLGNDPSRAVELATSALQRPACSSPAHATALYVLGDVHLKSSNLPAARQSLERLVKYRRYSEDWLLLAVARARSGDRRGAIAALEKAVQIAPFRADVHQLLSEGYSAIGNTDAARRHRQIAESL